MDARFDSLKRVLAGPLAALTLTLSVAVPVLERADVAHERAIESEHHSTCPRPHDHTIHRLVGANEGVRSSTPAPGPREAVVRLVAPLPAAPVRSAEPTHRPSARAPPSA